MKIRNPTYVMYLAGCSRCQKRLRGVNTRCRKSFGASIRRNLCGSICVFLIFLLFLFSLPLFPARAFAFFNGHTALCENAVSLMRVDTFSPDGLMCLVVSPAGAGDGNDVVVSPARSWGSGADDACATPGDFAATPGDFVATGGDFFSRSGGSHGRGKASPAATPVSYG